MGVKSWIRAEVNRVRVRVITVDHDETVTNEHHTEEMNATITSYASKRHVRLNCSNEPT